MNLLDHDIDRILREEPTRTPSPGFKQAVMRAVRQQTEWEHGLAFPWPRLAWGLGTCGVLTIAAIVALLLGGPAAAPSVPEPVARALRHPDVMLALTWGPVLLAGSYAFAWSSVRLAGHR